MEGGGGIQHGFVLMDGRHLLKNVNYKIEIAISALKYINRKRFLLDGSSSFVLWWHKYCIWQQLNGNTFFSQVLPLLSNYSEVIDWSCYPQPPSSHTPTNKTLQQLFFTTFFDCCPFKQIKQGQLQLYNTQKNLPAVIVLTIFPKAIAIFINK